MVKHGLTNRQIAKLADANTDLHGVADLKRLIEEADLVFGVWKDPEEEDGVGTLIIKGEGLLDRIIHLGQAESRVVTAVRCRDINEAEAMRLTFGDTARRQ